MDKRRYSGESRPGILLIHGFGGGPEELAALEEHLKDEGFETRLPLLPGHGKQQRRRSELTRDQWKDAVERSYLELAHGGRRVVVIGFSMGGLLAANLWNYAFDGLILINTPIYYWNVPQMFQNIRSDAARYGKRYREASDGKTISSCVEFQMLLSSTKPLFRRLHCRTLILQAADDDTVWPGSADYILRRIQGPKLLLKLPEGGHQVLEEKAGAKNVLRAVDCFLCCDHSG